MTLPSACRTSAVASLAAALLLAGVTLAARAELADRDKPVQIEADKMLLDDAKKESLFQGNVVVTQGTLQLRGDRVIVRQDADGFQYGIAYGKPAKFRQKREGFDEYIEGFADRVEYDGRKDLLQMFTGSRLTKGADEVEGDYISYNAKTEFFQVIGKPAGTATATEGGRVRAVIQPKQKPTPDSPDAAGAAPTRRESVILKPAPGLERTPGR